METYSFSKLKCFESCKLCFYTTYFEKPECDKMSHGTSEFGSFVHNILEKYEKNELETFELLDYYKDNYNTNVISTFDLYLSESFVKNFENDYYTSGIEYLENFNGFDDIHILEAEYEFEVPVDNLFLFNGKIDLIAEDNDGNFIIIDHKSKKKFASKKEKAEYARQLYLYAFAVKQKYGKLPTKLMFNMFRNKEWVVFDFNETDYLNAIDWAKNTVKEIEQTFDFNPTLDTFFCRNFCSYRHVCKAKNIN